MASACRIGFEGVIGKRRDAPYASRRNGDWIKLKCSQRQEFVIGGWTDPQGARTGLGALLLGVHDDGRLRYAGNVGTGFSQQTLATLREKLDALARKDSPFDPQPAGTARVHWVEPRLLAEVSFGEWTETGRIRHSVFHGLREDKPARAIGRERAVKPEARPPAQAMTKTLPAGRLHVTHADRVIDPSTGLTKLDLVRYYATVAPLMLEHLRQRPVALVRAPDGVDGEKFFQKHAENTAIPGWTQLDARLDPGHAPLLEPATPEALPEAAQFNVVELHSWNARHDRIERPDRIVFDLDPGEGVPWPRVQEGAQLLQVLLQELGLPAFLKTSGGKGLHVVVPIRRLHGWDAVKGFAQAVVQHLAQTIPDRFVAKSGPRNRVGKIFVDYLRNGRGATTAAAWSARARPGLGISVPVGWDELAALSGSAHWTIATVEQRLRTGNAPWQGYDKAAVSITQPMRRLGL
ncbi:MAG: Multifunctional non-homologous end joining protein LigD [Xylophilus sp.]|nr:MAG: Multifunctional non-homologous end joining protein LigD [Xylophilus sp.]